MRIILLLGLITYWLSHPGTVQHLVRLAAVAVGSLAHAGGDHTLAQGIVLPVLLGSHWH